MEEREADHSVGCDCCHRLAHHRAAGYRSDPDKFCGAPAPAPANQTIAIGNEARHTRSYTQTYFIQKPEGTHTLTLLLNSLNKVPIRHSVPPAEFHVGPKPKYSPKQDTETYLEVIQYRRSGLEQHPAAVILLEGRSQFWVLRGNIDDAPFCFALLALSNVPTVVPRWRQIIRFLQNGEISSVDQSNPSS